MKETLKKIRMEIDRIDDDIIDLLQRRCELSEEVGVLKQKNNKDTFDPSRETAIIKRLASKVKPPLTRSLVEGMFNEIFSISRSLQKKKNVAFLGPEGSYSHQATYNIFSHDAVFMPQKDIDSVVQEVITGRADLGIVPVENSTEGMINRTMDLMAESRLVIRSEIMLPIRNCLLTNAQMHEITKVYSHPQPLAQCRNWLMKNLPDIPTIETSSTSNASIAASEEKNTAAVASSLCAQLYGLKVLVDNINDYRENMTRFWIIAKNMAPIEGPAKTSIIVTLENTPGSLYNAIGIFADEGINLTKIESRPSKKNPWEYLFFIDFQGNLKDEPVVNVMKRIKQYTREVIVLGSYPEGRRLD